MVSHRCTPGYYDFAWFHTTRSVIDQPLRAMTKDVSDPTPSDDPFSAQQPPRRRPGWAPPPSRTAPDASESTPRIRVNAPRFNGEDPIGWIFKIQKYFDYFYTSDEHRLLFISIFIDHPASEWYRYFLCTNVDATWMDFLFAVKQRFDPGFGENSLQDLAALTGGDVITEELGMNLEDVKLDMSGACKKVTISKDDTVVLDGAGDKKTIEERCEQIRPAIELSTSDNDKEKLHERLTKLSGGVAVLKIGGPSEAEVGEKKDGVTDALNATKATVEEGIVPGGGVSRLYASNELDKLPTANFDQKSGVQIIQNALKTPVHSVTSNAGVEGAIVVGKLLETDAPDQRTLLVHGESHDQWRIPWSDGSPDSWEPVPLIRQHFPHIHLEDKVIFEDGGVDTYVPTSLTDSRTPRIRQQPTRFAEYVT